MIADIESLAITGSSIRVKRLKNMEKLIGVAEKSTRRSQRNAQWGGGGERTLGGQRNAHVGRRNAQYFWGETDTPSHR